MTNAAPGVLNANFETNVFEEGGDFSVDRFTLPYYPFLTYAGIRVPANKENDRMLYTGRTTISAWLTWMPMEIRFLRTG